MIIFSIINQVYKSKNEKRKNELHKIKLLQEQEKLKILKEERITKNNINYFEMQKKLQKDLNNHLKNKKNKK